MYLSPQPLVLQIPNQQGWWDITLVFPPMWWAQKNSSDSHKYSDNIIIHWQFIEIIIAVFFFDISVGNHLDDQWERWSYRINFKLWESAQYRYTNARFIKYQWRSLRLALCLSAPWNRSELKWFIYLIFRAQEFTYSIKLHIYFSHRMSTKQEWQKSERGDWITEGSPPMRSIGIFCKCLNPTFIFQYY